MKKCIIIPAYNNFDNELPLGIGSWKIYANKFDIDIYIFNDILQPIEGINSWENGAWSKWKGVESLITKYDKILLVDADTLVRWDCVDIFEMTKNYEFCCIKDSGGYSTGIYHFKQWESHPSFTFTPNPTDYFNTGVLLFSKNIGKIIIENINEYFIFWKKQKQLQKIDAVEQTAINIISQKYFYKDVIFLNDMFNDMVLCKYHDFSFINKSYIWHFTGPNMGGWGNKVNIMEQVWDCIKDQYN
jgi:lipopolysaccharide biosynthesis glycosyltransferase